MATVYISIKWYTWQETLRELWTFKGLSKLMTNADNNIYRLCRMGEHKELRRSILNDNKNMYKFYDKAWQHTDTNKNKGEEQKMFVQGKIIWNHFWGENSSPLTYLASDLALLEHHEDFVSCPLKKKKTFLQLFFPRTIRRSNRFAGRRQHVHFSVILQPWVLVRARGSNPWPTTFASQRSIRWANPAAEKFFKENPCGIKIANLS